MASQVTMKRILMCMTLLCPTVALVIPLTATDRITDEHMDRA